MGIFLTLARREALIILRSPLTYLAATLLVMVNSFAFYMITVNHATAYAIFDDMAAFMLFTSIIMCPIVTMDAFSEENASGTLETLLTAPVSHRTAILAKYMGAMVFVVLYLMHGLVYAALLSIGGNLDWNSTLSAMLALFAVGSMAVALGVFISTLTISPVTTAAGTAGILVFLTFTADFDPYAGLVSDILNSISFIPHAKRWIAGELDTRGLVYFLSTTALFLFYAWLSLGTRSLEKRLTGGTVRRRIAVTYFLILGAIASLAVQAALLHIRGFWESGTPFGPGFARVPTLLMAPLVVAAGLFLWSYLTFRAARRAERGERKTRQLKYRTISESRVMGAPRYYYEEHVREKRRIRLAALAGLMIVLSANWLTHYPFRTFAGSAHLSFLTHLQERRWDVSHDRRNTLSVSTRKVLDSLQGRLAIYSFLSESSEDQGVPVAEEMRRLLGRYSDYTALVTPHFADALREPEMAAELAQELEIPESGLGSQLVLSYQNRLVTIPSSLLTAPPPYRAQLTGDNRWVFDGENRLTQAIMRLVDPRVPTTFFTYGHGELSLQAGPYPDQAASRFSQVLAGANMRVRQHNITPPTGIPPECDILIIAAPRSPYSKAEVQEIDGYLARGGRLLVLAPSGGIEYAFDEDPLNALLFSAGGGYRNDLIEDRVNNSRGQLRSPLAYPRRIGEGSVNFVFPSTRSLRDNPLAHQAGWQVERMVESHPTATAINPEDGSRRDGPFTLVLRSRKTTGQYESRLAVVASGTLAANAGIDKAANESLLIGLVQWLAGREESKDIEPRLWIDRRLHLAGPQYRAILWIGNIFLPMAWLMAGISIWYMRRL